MISVHITPEELIYDYRDVKSFENGSVFENVFRPPLKRKAVSFKFHQLKKPVFKKLHFHEELVRTVGLHEEIKYSCVSKFIRRKVERPFATALILSYR